jgi:serine/threonine-protein kinase RsbW
MTHSGHYDREVEIIRLDIPGSLKYLNLLESAVDGILERVDDLDAHAPVSTDIRLALHELCTNIARHAYSDCDRDRILLTFELASTRRELRITTVDTGSEFDPSKIPAPDLENGQMHGYGLYLMRKLMDEVEYQTSQAGNRWRMMKKL